FVIDHKYYVKDNYFYCKDSGGNIKWEVEIWGFEKGPAIVNFNYKIVKPKALVSRLSVETFLLRPLMYYKLLEKGYVMIHSAGVSKEGEAYIFPGRGGAFKTSLTMGFIKRANFKYLGDDRVILYQDRVLSFPAHFYSFQYTYQKRDDEFISYFDKLKFIFNHDKYINYINKNVLPIEDSSKLRAVFFVVKKNTREVKFTKLETQEAITKLINSSKMEMKAISDSIPGFFLNPYYTYMQAYSYVFPKSRVGKYWDNLKKELGAILKKDIPIYEIKIPEKYTQTVFREVLTFVRGLKWP
ncbi:hypothetical protein, partial [Thermococcus sp. GR7]